MSSESNDKKTNNVLVTILLIVVFLTLGVAIGYVIKENEVNTNVTDTVETNQTNRQEALESAPPPPSEPSEPAEKPVEEPVTQEPQE